MSPMVRRPPSMELALLGFLVPGPQHGYQIHQMVSDPAGLGPIWRLKQSQLYALLTKLEKDGYTWGILEPQDVARPPRRMYHLTRKGQIAFKDWLHSPVSAPRLMRQEFMAKLYFLRREGVEEIHALIDAQSAVCQRWLEAFHAEQVDVSSFSWVIYQYRMGQIQAALDWLEACRQRAGDLANQKFLDG
jgi:PadR family transcriptional regulator, regulatory protein AphA